MGEQPGIWSQTSDGRWTVQRPSGFASEADLHDLIERNPEMMPLAGSPALAVLGREVSCGRESADLLAVEVESGRLVVIETKLAKNSDKRQVFTQVLGYASWLSRLGPDGLEDLLKPHLARRGLDSIEAAAQASMGDPNLDRKAFHERLQLSLAEGRLRCVVVLDNAPAELVDLAGYLQDVTNERLTLDVVTVGAYDVGTERIMVPQLAEPDSSPVPRGLAPSKQTAQVILGSADFERYLEEMPADATAELGRLLSWAQGCEREKLVVLHSYVGSTSAILHLRVPGEQRSMVTIWTEAGGKLSPYRTVFEALAPNALSLLDREFPDQVRQNNFVADSSDRFLALVRAGYAEAAGVPLPVVSSEQP